MKRVAIYGFGLIGASVALALRARHGDVHVTALDRNDVVGSPAVRAASNAQVAVTDSAEVGAALGACDVCVLAAPVSVVVERVAAVLDLARVVTDCGSTKRAVVRAAAPSERAAWFVPGHPLAGAPVGGAESGRADLFEGRKWVLCPEGREARALDAARTLARWVGAEPVELDAAAHDHALALTSHVPQLLSSALRVLSDRRDSRRCEGPGFASATRTAGANEAVWADIFQTNADEVARALRELGGELARIADELEQDPPSVAAATKLLRAARRG